MATRRVRDPQVFADEAVAACARLLGKKASNVDWPASRSRRSVRVYIEDLTVIATRRKRRECSMLEANVLKTLHEHGAPVPAVHAYDGVWLIQEYLAGERLPHVLVDCDTVRAHELLSSAANGLARILPSVQRRGCTVRSCSLGPRQLVAGPDRHAEPDR